MNIIYSRSPSFTDVSTAIGLAKDGDEVDVPTGAATWTNYISVSKRLTITGHDTVLTNRSTRKKLIVGAYITVTGITIIS